MRSSSVLGLACVAALSCARAEPADSGGDALVEVGRIELEELSGDPIVGIELLGRRPGGGYILADRQADKVRLFDASGRQQRVLGGTGEGPGELREPGGAVEFPDGRIVVVERASPRLTVFRPDSAPTVARIPGQYGFWVERVGDGLVAGVATRDTRFATLTSTGTLVTAFGRRDPSVAATPFWIYFAAERAAVLGDLVAVNTSLFRAIRLFSIDGDSIASFETTPSEWVQATVPPVADLSAPGNRERVADWARSFTVVRQLAAVADSLLLVEYGRYDPQDADPYYIEPTTADIYSRAGDLLAAGLQLPGPVVGGGDRLLVLVAGRPSVWTLAELEWRPVGDR